MTAGVVAVAGGRGLIGRHVVAALRAAGHDVVSLVRPGPAGEGEGEVGVELADVDAVARVLRDAGARAVCHAFWTGHPRSSATGYAAQVAVNLDPTIALAAACGTSGVEHLVHVSTGGGTVDAAVTGRRPPAYGWAKAVAEAACEASAAAFGYRLTTLRPSAVYGPGQDPDAGLGAITVFLARMLRGEPIQVLGDPGQTRDFLHVADLAECVVRVVERRPVGTFAVGGPEPLRVDALVALVAAVLERPAELVIEPPTGFDNLEVRLDDRPITAATGWAPTRRVADALPALAVDVADRLGLRDRLPARLR